MKRTLFIALLSLAVFSCKKENNNPKTVPAAVVRCFITAAHHSVPVPYCSLFVKWGTVNFPGTDSTLYDERHVCDANGQFTLTGIPNGDEAFTVYAKGIDAGWDSTHATPVWGEKWMIISTHQLESKDTTLDIPVSE
ncbi:MAG TPA: hypothetical protein VL651_03015 [Bacteroidia bacterium]|jgi:hypothetical protein|nr:hypothetical protein [Bacteroidia bacterium]